MFGNDDVASDMPTKFKNCFKLPSPAKTASAPAAAQTQPESNSIRTTTTTNETVRTLRATASRSSSPSTMQDLKAQVLQQRQEMLALQQQLSQAQAVASAPSPAVTFATAATDNAQTLVTTPFSIPNPNPFSTDQALGKNSFGLPSYNNTFTSNPNNAFGSNSQTNAFSTNTWTAGRGSSSSMTNRQQQQWNQLQEKLMLECLSGTTVNDSEVELLKMSKQVEKPQQ